MPKNTKQKSMPVEQLLRFALAQISNRTADEGTDEAFQNQLRMTNELDAFAKEHGFASLDAAVEKAYSDPDYH